MRRCKARKATPHAGCVGGTNGSGYWGRSAENHLPMGLGRADSLRGREAVGDNAQPLGGWAMRGHFKSTQISRGCIAAIAVIRFLSLSADYRLCPVSRQRQAPGISELCGA